MDHLEVNQRDDGDQSGNRDDRGEDQRVSCQPSPCLLLVALGAVRPPVGGSRATASPEGGMRHRQELEGFLQPRWHEGSPIARCADLDGGRSVDSRRQWGAVAIGGTPR
jgi:hypothetical protein